LREFASLDVGLLRGALIIAKFLSCELKKLHNPINCLNSWIVLSLTGFSLFDPGRISSEGKFLVRDPYYFKLITFSYLIK
jgi:hypothetical protein